MNSVSGFAVECTADSVSEAKVPWSMYKISISGGADLVLVKTPTVPLTVKQQITSLMNDESIDYLRIQPQAEKILSENQDMLAEHAAMLGFLNSLLEKREMNYLIIDYPSESIPDWEKFTNRLYLNAFMMQVRTAPKDVSLDRMILLDVGVPLYLKAVVPDRFVDVSLEGVNSAPVKASVKEPVDEEEKPVRRSSAKSGAFDRLIDKLEGSRQSIRQAHRARAQLRSHAFSRLSDSEKKEKILAHFWRPAKPAVREWLNAELSGGDEDSHSKPVRRSKRVASKSLAETLLQRKGSGMAFLREDKFENLKNEFSNLCE
jgi:hypothetical protein